jgi:hypothetical protein
MLDIHAPDHPIQGVRDFLIHLLTITVGLLIALGLEAAVEAAHHRHQRDEAEAKIIGELRAGQANALDSIPQVTHEADNMGRLIAFLQARAQGEKADPSGIDITFHESPVNDSAWRTAVSTGALSYMPYDEVQRFAQAYKEQDLLQTTEEAALDDYLELGALARTTPHPREMSPADAAAALPLARRALAHVDGMVAVGGGMLHSYKEALGR